MEKKRQSVSLILSLLASLVVMSSFASSLSIDYVDPTRPDGITTSENFSYVNTTLEGVGNLTALIDWNHSLIGWYRFEGNLNDNSGYNNGGTCSFMGCPTFIPGYTDTIFGSGTMFFDGAFSYVDLSSHKNDLEFNTSVGTIELWYFPWLDNLYSQLFNFRKVDTATYIIVREHTKVTGSYVQFIGEINDVVQFDVRTPSGSIAPNSWNHLVFQQTGSGLEAYINGQKMTLVGTNPTSTMWFDDTFPADEDITIGHWGDWADSTVKCYFNGFIEEFRIYSRPLKESEIRASYNASLYPLEANFTNLADGLYEYTAYVEEGNGNIDSVTRTVNISSVYTSSTPSTPASSSGTLGIGFIDPTGDNGDTINNNHAYVNTTVTGSGDLTSLIDWNHSLIGWWRLDGGFQDNSTWDNDCTCTDCPAYTSSGKFGGAYTFSSDRLNCGADPEFNLQGNVTIEAWVRTTVTADTGQHGIAGKGYSMYTLTAYNGDMVHMQIRLPGPSYPGVSYDTNGVLQDNQWHHIVGTYDNQYIRIYFDGVERNQEPETGLMDTDSNDFYVGFYDPQDLYFDGTIDEVRVWKRALSEAEIRASYNAGLYRLGNNFTNLQDGEYEYTAYVQNSTGHIAKTETRTININNIPAAAPPSSPNTYTINGTISDIDSGSALDGVDVIISNATDTYTVTTDSLGIYELAGLYPSTYTITTFMSGYGAESDTLTIVSENHTIDFSLDYIDPSIVSYRGEARIDPSNSGNTHAFRLGTTNTIPVLLKNPTDDYILMPIHVGSRSDYYRNLISIVTGTGEKRDLNITLYPGEERYISVRIIAGVIGSHDLTIGPDTDLNNIYDSITFIVIDRDSSGLFSETPGMGYVALALVIVICAIASLRHNPIRI